MRQRARSPFYSTRATDVPRARADTKLPLGAWRLRFRWMPAAFTRRSRTIRAAGRTARIHPLSAMRATLCLLVLFLASGCSDSADAPPQAPEVPADAPVADTSLELRFPTEMIGLERRSLETSVDAALDASVTTVTSRYGALNSTGEPSLEIYLTEYGSTDMAEMMGLGWATSGATDYAAGTEVQASEEFDGHPARRTWDTATRKGRLQVVAGGTLLVEVRGENVPEEALDAAARTALTAPE